jgi:carbonic anhydrase
MELPRTGRGAAVPGRSRVRASEALHGLLQKAGRTRGPGTVRRPTAALLTCVDERVVPEAIFGCDPGSLYAVRLAGNIVIPEVVSSLEIALGLGCPLVLVLGHTDCSAVRLEREGTCDHFPITQHIRRATRPLPLHAGLEEAIEANVLHSVWELRSRLGVSVEGGIYDVVTGRVRMLTRPAVAGTAGWSFTS